MIVLKIAATSNARHTLDRNSKICLLILKPTATYCEQIFTYTRSTVRHIRLLCCTAASPTRLIHLIRSPALSTQSSVLLSPVHTYTAVVFPLSHSQSPCYLFSILFYSASCGSCVLLAHSLSLFASLSFTQFVSCVQRTV